MNRIRPRTTARRSQAAGAGKTCAARFAAARLSAALLLFALIVAALPALAAAAPAASGEDVPLIPRRVLFSDPERSTVRLSPDGRWISYLAPADGVLNVWVAPVDDPGAAKPVTHDRDRGIAGYGWTYLESHLVYVQDTAGDENWRVYSVDVTTGETRLLTPASGVYAQLVAFSPQHPEEIVVGLNDRIPQFHDLYRVNLRTGERTLIEENNGMLAYFLDDDYRVRFAATMTADGGVLILAASEDGWQPFWEISAEDSMTSWPLLLDPSGTKLYLLDSTGRETAALVVLDLETGSSQVIYEDPKADVDELLVHPTERTIQAAASTYARRTWTILDPSIETDLAYLESLDDGELSVVSRTLDDSRWIAAFTRDDGPVRYYVYDREAGEARFLFTNHPVLEEYTLAKMHPVIIPSRDGLELVSYLTLPPWEEREGTIRPSRPLPLVLEVHGGPWSRDAWGYNPVHQWLANRGYAVLSVNFRGSLGFGKTFLNAGNLEWGGKMHDDLIDAVNWAIEQGIADPEKVCISGGSYGGYAARGGAHLHSRRLCLRRLHRGPLQPGDAPGVDPALLGAPAGAVRHARGRPPHAGGPGVPARALAAHLRPPHPKAAPHRPGSQRPPGEAVGVGPDRRGHAGGGDPRHLRALSRRGPRLRPAAQPALLLRCAGGLLPRAPGRPL